MEQTIHPPAYSSEIMDFLERWLLDHNCHFLKDPKEGVLCLYTGLCGENKHLLFWIDVGASGFHVVTRYDLSATDQEGIDQVSRFFHRQNDYLNGGLLNIGPGGGLIHHLIYCDCTDGFPSDKVMEDSLWLGVDRFGRLDSILQRIIAHELTDEELEKFCGYPLPWYRVFWNKLTGKKA